MRSTTARLAMAAVIVLAVALGLSLFVGDGGSKAYAQVVDLLHNAKTMTFSVINKTGLESSPTVRTTIAFKEPCHMRITNADGFITVVHNSGDRVHGINLIPVQKGYIQFELSNLPDNADSGLYVSAEKLRALPDQANEVLGKAKIDGRLLEGYVVYDGDTTTTVWLDPDTGELARAELEFATAPGMDMILTDFRFDVPLDDSLFSLEPPADYSPLSHELKADVTTTTEADLIEFLRLWSSWTVDRVFPPTVNGPELGEISFQMAKEGKFIGPVPRGYEPDQLQEIMYRGMAFMGTLPVGTWRYAGQNATFGDPDLPIFWYRPEGSPTYRVIYADLSVQDVAPEDFPQ